MMAECWRDTCYVVLCFGECGGVGNPSAEVPSDVTCVVRQGGRGREVWCCFGRFRTIVSAWSETWRRLRVVRFLREVLCVGGCARVGVWAPLRVRSLILRFSRRWRRQE